MLETLKIQVWWTTAIILLGCFILFLCDKELLLLAAKNLTKNLRRTLILLCVMVFGLGGLMQFFGYGEFNIYNLREATIRAGLGHLQLYQKGYNAAANVDKMQYNIRNHQAVIDIVNKDPYFKDKVEIIGYELYMSGIIASDKTSAVFMGKGIDVATDKRLSETDSLVEGKALEVVSGTFKKQLEPTRINESEDMFEAYDNVEPGQPRKDVPKIWVDRKKDEQIDKPGLDDALIGSGLANALGAKPGSVLTLVVATRTNTLNAVDIKVRGIIKGMSNEYNDAVIKLALPYAWVLMNRKDISKISILLKDTKLTDEAQQRLQAIIADQKLDLETTNWRDIATYYISVHTLFVGIFVTIGFVITIIVISTIMNVMLMNVSERVREIGTLRALGTTRGGIMKLFFMEAILVGVGGSLLAILGGIGFAEFVNQILGGIPQPAPPGSSEGFVAFLYVANRPLIWGIVLVLGFFSTLFSAILPVSKAGNMQIIDCLRHT